MIGKIATTWAGTSGGPGITQMYVEAIGQTLLTQAQAQSAVNAVRNFFLASASYLPDELALAVQPTVDMYDHGNGTLTNTITAATAPALVGGTSVAAYSMASGFKVNLQTTDIRNGRRVRGTVYFVPAGSNSMNTDGYVAAATRTAMNTAGASLLSALGSAGLQLIVWGRPIKDSAGTITRQGTINPVTTIDTAEKTAILRGRRD